MKQFFCCVKAFDGPQMKQHLKADHSLSDLQILKTYRTATSFIDGAKGFYQQDYDCECAGVKFHMTVSGFAKRH